MLHHGIESNLGTTINISDASKNHDFEDREFGETLLTLSSDQSCGMIIRDIYLSLEPFGALLDARVGCCSKLG